MERSRERRLHATRSNSSSYTDARLRAVMPEVGGDFYSLAAAGLISFDVASAMDRRINLHPAAGGRKLLPGSVDLLGPSDEGAALSRQQ